MYITILVALLVCLGGCGMVFYGYREGVRKQSMRWGYAAFELRGRSARMAGIVNILFGALAVAVAAVTVVAVLM